MTDLKLPSYSGLAIPYGTKLAICLAADLFNMTLGRVLLGLDTAFDAVNALVMYLLWGPIGLFAIWEVADVTEQIDGMVPTNTIIAVVARMRGKIQ